MTEYVVLERVSEATSQTREAWCPVGTYEAHSKLVAIRKHTGNGESVIEGTWKAVPFVSWQGGEVTRRKVTADRLPFDDD